MKYINIGAKITVCNYIELNKIEKSVIDTAKGAVKGAYSPYSQFRVGASVLLANGETVCGSNQENAAYPSGLCAERTALFYACSRFPDVAVEMIGLAAFCNGGYTDDPVTPCGACRQVMLEVEKRYNSPVKLLLYGEKAIYRIERVSDLLPLAF
ncbi:MAG: cytidine deaminase [Candidatus Symbiothrix sp.]|jgi:cytidine deaminase|nr:cytidine deaminase [Candidatus Symbiothrix sp.]